MALASGSIGLGIKETITMAIATNSFAFLACKSNSARTFCFTSGSQETALAHTVCLVILDYTFTMIGARVTSLVGRALKVTCLSNPACLASTLGVIITDCTALSMVRAHIIGLVSRARQEAILSKESIITVTLGCES